MQELGANPEMNLFAKIPHGDGQMLLREALLLADHNAYHLGGLAVMKRMVKEEKGRCLSRSHNVLRRFQQALNHLGNLRKRFWFAKKSVSTLTHRLFLNLR